MLPGGGEKLAAARVGALVVDRYRLGAPIGAGGMGSVFAAHDTVLDRAVALKLLGTAAGVGETVAAAYDELATRRLLTEAKIGARVAHPACVQIFDGGVDPRLGPFVVMELLEGEDLSRFLQRQGPLDLPLALAFAHQLCDIVQAVHAAGVVHCDLKPGNLFVLRSPAPGDSAPRLKLLDFGIARLREAHQDRLGAPAPTGGTPPYMAPELWLDPVAPHADLEVGADVYALGAIVYEMLAGQPPYRAESRAALRLALLADEVTPLAARRPEVPGWLSAAIMNALRRQRSERPRDVAAFARSLGVGGRTGPAATPDGPAGDRATNGGRRGNPAVEPRGDHRLIGRDDLLSVLENELATATEATPKIVLIEGASGIGKSALLDAFRARLADRADTVVLSGQARHGDGLPFPALEQVLADLNAYLASLPPPVAEILVPRGGVGRPTGLPDESRPGKIRAAGVDVRRLALEDLREVFVRLAQSRQVVLVIDDLHWVDGDGRAILAHLLGGTQRAPILLIGTVRSNDRGGELRKLEAAIGRLVRRVTLGPLSPADARALLVDRWAGPATLDAALADRLATAAGGVPFLLELCAAGPATRLEDALDCRIGRLGPGPRRALEAVCVAWRPLPVQVVLDATATAALSMIAELCAAALLRWTRVGTDWHVEPYHDQIRVAVRATLDGAAIREHHRQLAAALRRGSSHDTELLVEHLAAAGESVLATDVALEAARAASDHLAHDRAAALLKVALQHGRHDAETRLRLVRQRARALQLAHRGRDCGDALLAEAGRMGDGEVADRLRVEAGTHLLSSGDVRRGIEALTPALAALGLRVPVGLEETIGATRAAMTALGGRAIAFTPAAAGPNADAVARVDLCLALAQGLAHADLRVLPFACQGLVTALALGDPERLQRAAALFVINTVEYLPNPLVEPALDLCRELTEAAPAPYARALLAAAVAEHAHFKGDFLEAEAAFERAERTLLDHCPEATRELATVRDLGVFVQYAQKGDFVSQLVRTQRWLAEADAARDAYHASMLRVAHAIVWIAQDDPARARAELQRAEREWPGEAGVLAVGAALYHDIIDRYEAGDVGALVQDDARAALLRSPAAQTPFLGGYLGLQDAWKTLRTMAARETETEGGAAAVTAIADRLRGTHLPIWAAVADALEANLAVLVRRQGGRERAAHLLDQAETRFKRMGMYCLASCARHRRGELVEGDLGARLRGEATGELHRLGVVDVRRWTRAYWSMFDTGTVLAQTFDSLVPEGASPAGGPAALTRRRGA